MADVETANSVETAKKETTGGEHHNWTDDERIYLLWVYFETKCKFSIKHSSVKKFMEHTSIRGEAASIYSQHYKGFHMKKKIINNPGPTEKIWKTFVDDQGVVDHVGLDLEAKRIMDEFEFLESVLKTLETPEISETPETSGTSEISETPETKSKTISKTNFSDTEKRALVVLRPHQREFRKNLLEAYDRTCCITHMKVFDGCTSALEACHIRGYDKDDPYETQVSPTIGLLMNCTHHALFDSYLMTIVPKRKNEKDKKEYIIMFSQELLDKANSLDTKNEHSELKWVTSFHGKKIKLPQNSENYPDEDRIEHHNKMFAGRNGIKLSDLSFSKYYKNSP